MLRHASRLAALTCVIAAVLTASAYGQTTPTHHRSIQAISSSYRWVIHNCSPSNEWCGWKRTVDCENSGRWYDTPGQFYYGLQFDYGSMNTSVRHTGVPMSAYPPSQIVNAIWLRDNSLRDPWPNCPNP